MKHANHIGCSGYYYSAWRNAFYPKGLKPAAWLNYYSTVFDTVELNGTFYRKPKVQDLQKYYSNTTAHFKFSVKMSRYITHIKRLADCKQEIEDFNLLVEDGLKDKLACILYQMPPSFQYSEENLENVLNAIYPKPTNIIEFRHGSWWNADAIKSIKQHGITMCNVDFPGLEVPIIKTSPIFYLRMHGNPILFKSRYTLETLEQVKDNLPRSSKERFIYFNNTYYDGGYSNAQELSKMMEIT